MPKNNDPNLKCSFCGKTQDQVKKLIINAFSAYKYVILAVYKKLIFKIGISFAHQ